MAYSYWSFVLIRSTGRAIAYYGAVFCKDSCSATRQDNVCQFGRRYFTVQGGFCTNFIYTMFDTGPGKALSKWVRQKGIGRNASDYVGEYPLAR
jgi:hypothetical protein